MPSKFEAATGGARLNAVIVTADPATGRATAIERVNLSAAEVEALAESQRGDVALTAASTQRCQTSSRSPSRKTRPTDRTAAAAARPQRRVVLRHRADRRHPRHARIALRRRLGRGRDLQLPGLEHRPRLLHPEGRSRADSLRDVPLGRPLPASSRSRTACTSSRAAGWGSTSPKASISSSASTCSPAGSGRCSSRSSN